MRDDRFEQLYQDHAGPLFSFLVYRTGDRALAEDILADAFERVLRSRRRFDPRRGSEKTWLYTIALNCLRDHVRRRAAEGRALDRVDQTASAEPGTPFGVDLENPDELQHALAGLSEEEREAIALRYGADMTVPEIAKLLKEPLTTVEGRVYRALRRLREELE
jgi:RNA polymerase sigma factor (sigma-70 family)